MATEIELKAWVDDPEALARRLSSLAEFTGSFEKEDVYWFPAPGSAGLPPSGVRVRRLLWKANGDAATGVVAESAAEGGFAKGRAFTTTLVTYKSKEVRDRIEINDEREFTVSDSEPFEELLRRLGLEPGIGKTKRGRGWKQGDLTAELSLIEGLGWFIEVEILAGDDSPETVGKARARLLDFLEKTAPSRGGPTAAVKAATNINACKSLRFILLLVPANPPLLLI